MASNKENVLGPEFHHFPRLPPELQNIVWDEALRKPSVHFFKPTPCQDSSTPQGWYYRLGRSSRGKNDTSGYLHLQELSKVCQSAAKAVQLAEGEMHRISFTQYLDPRNRNRPRIKEAPIDKALDLVCIDFTKNARTNDGAEFQVWSRNLGPTFNTVPFKRDKVVALHAGIRRVALEYAAKNPDCGESSAVFQCLERDNTHLKWKMCPEELAAYLDTFPDLEAVYIIAGPVRTNEHKALIKHETDRFFACKVSAAHSPRKLIILTRGQQFPELSVRPATWSHSTTPSTATSRCQS